MLAYLLLEAFGTRGAKGLGDELLDIVIKLVAEPLREIDGPERLVLRKLVEVARAVEGHAAREDIGDGFLPMERPFRQVKVAAIESIDCGAREIRQRGRGDQGTTEGKRRGEIPAIDAESALPSTIAMPFGSQLQ